MYPVAKRNDQFIQLDEKKQLPLNQWLYIIEKILEPYIKLCNEHLKKLDDLAFRFLSYAFDGCTREDCQRPVKFLAQIKKSPIIDIKDLISTTMLPEFQTGSLPKKTWDNSYETDFPKLLKKIVLHLLGIHSYIDIDIIYDQVVNSLGINEFSEDTNAIEMGILRLD